MKKMAIASIFLTLGFQFIAAPAKADTIEQLAKNYAISMCDSANRGESYLASSLEYAFKHNITAQNYATYSNIYHSFEEYANTTLANNRDVYMYAATEVCPARYRIFDNVFKYVTRNSKGRANFPLLSAMFSANGIYEK
jgi:hypothetical protein